jgi:predicted metalloprotease
MKTEGQRESQNVEDVRGCRASLLMAGRSVGLGGIVTGLLADTEDVWDAHFQRSGQRHPEPKLVIFRDRWPTGCSTGEAAMGPFHGLADCFAGVWTNLSQRSKGWLEQGDIEEALNAAAHIGDDTLQYRSQGSAVPESFTHGSSAQRVRWVKRGLEAGALPACDTFSSATL